MRLLDFQAIPNLATTDQSATVGSSATLLTALVTIHAQTRFVRISVDDDDVRYTISGTTPTSSLGRRLPVDAEAVLSEYEINTAKFIRVTGNATIQVQQFIN
jgi:uncharacterized protein (UPF0548 family)